MNVSDIINSVLCVLSFLLAAISVVTVVITLRQNNKMIESDSRPYVVAYMVYEEFSSHLYFYVKNYGKTGAIIKSIQITPEFRVYKKMCNSVLVNVLIAPMQQFHFLIDFKEKDRITNEKEFNYVAEMTYVDCVTQKEYKEKYDLNIDYVLEVLSSHHNMSKLSELENSVRNIELSMETIKLHNL